MRVLKIVFMAIIGITLVTGPVYAASQGKDKDKDKGKSEDKSGADNNQGRGKGRVEGSLGPANANRSGNARAQRGNSDPRGRRNQIDRARGQADARANRPEKQDHGLSAGHNAVGVNKSARIAHGKSAYHKKLKDPRIDDLFRALGKARWSYNPRDERGQGNMGKPNMRDPYGHDKDSGREKSERGRPIRAEQPEQSLLDLAGIVGVDFNIQDYYLNYLKSRLTYYLSYAQINHYMPRWIEYYESAIHNHLSNYGYMVRVNKDDTIDYTMRFSAPEGFEGTTLQVTTTLTSTHDYDYSYIRYVNDSTTGTWRNKKSSVHYDAGQVVMEQTQEVVLGPDNTFSFSYDPPADLAGYDGFNANLNVTVTEPVSEQSYTISYDRQLYLYRCPYGKVIDTESGEPIVGAKVTIRYEDGSIVPLDKASNPTATNPQITDATGRYGVKLQTNRKYYITAKASGYKDYKSEIFTEKWHVLREDVNLIPIKQIVSGR